MRERTKGFLSGILFTVLLISLSLSVYAAAQTISVNGGVKIVLDGQSFTPKDANGKTVDVFEYNGTTYVPVRAVSQAFGKEVSWDSSTRTVIIGKASSSAGTSTTDATISQKNALASAKSYLSFTSFSYDGLIKQLEFEKYSTEDATYAADNCGADWNEQAAKCAKSYLSFTSFSRDGLIDQLMFEGFTREQAEYGVTKNGY